MNRFLVASCPFLREYPVQPPNVNVSAATRVPCSKILSLYAKSAFPKRGRTFEPYRAPLPFLSTLYIRGDFRPGFVFSPIRRLNSLSAVSRDSNFHRRRSRTLFPEPLSFRMKNPSAPALEPQPVEGVLGAVRDQADLPHHGSEHAKLNRLFSHRRFHRRSTNSIQDAANGFAAKVVWLRKDGSLPAFAAGSESFLSLSAR